VLEEITPESCNSINFPGVLTTLKNAVNVPPLPEYWGAVEILIRPIHPFVVSELEVKEVLDQAAKEARLTCTNAVIPSKFRIRWPSCYDRMSADHLDSKRVFGGSLIQ